MATNVNNLLSEQAILNLEGQIPDVAQSATRTAHVRALAAGYTVLKVEGSCIVASQADGSSTVVGKTKPRRKVTLGEVVNVRKIGLNASA